MASRSTALLPLLMKAQTSNGRGTATDRELLRQFARTKGEAAFDALVKRHSSMVLGVCLRVLGNSADAEDVCQATFVVLACKAKTTRWQTSVASWLYATARQVALTARTARSRRMKHEGRVTNKPAANPLAQITGEELLAILDEELDKLHERYRAPVLLCCLEGLSRHEAAHQLGIPPATLKGNLERGRRRLHKSLARRGVSLGASLLAVLATSPAGASLSRMIETIRAAIVGKPPRSVAALAERVAVNGFMRKAILGAVMIAAVVAISVGFGAPTTTTAGHQPEKAATNAEAKEGTDRHPAKKAEEPLMRTITGKVLDSAGKPVVNVEMIHHLIDGRPEIVGKTAADGTFKVTVQVKPPGSWLYPRMDGFAPSEFLMPAINTPAEKTFTLVKDTPIRGRVVDTQGKPIAGASVAVRHMSGFENDSLDGFLASWLKRDPDSNGPASKWHVSLRSWAERTPPKEPHLYAAVTDSDGRFAIAHVGSERLVTLHIRGRGLADDEVLVATRAGFDPERYNKATLEKIRAPYSEIGYHPMLYPPEPNIVAESEKPIHGVVKETATGKPRVGATVTLRERRTVRLPEFRAVTDAEGRYEIHGAKKASQYEVSVKRDAKDGIIGRTVKLADTPAYEPVVADIGVGKGIILTGRVLDESTGKPIPGFACVGVLADNEFVQKPEFDSVDSYDFAYADKDGVYCTVVPPGPVLLMGGPSPDGKVGSKVYMKYEQIRNDPDYPDYFDKELSGFRSPAGATTIMQGQWCKVLKLKPEQSEVTADIVLKRAPTFTIKVQDSEGKPVSGAHAAGTTSRDWMHATECEDDTCTVYGLDQKVMRLVAMYDSKRGLAGVVKVWGCEKEPAIAKLVPTGTVKGVLLNAAGKPIANVGVYLSFKDRAVGEIDEVIRGDRRSGSPPIETNAAGEFTIAKVIPGQKFTVYARRNGQFLEPPDRKVTFAVKSSETMDLGQIPLKDD